MYVYAAPIYSGSFGNHYRLDDNANFGTITVDGIPDFAHLIWNEQEMRAYFEKHPLPREQAQVDALCDWSYYNDGITRRMYSDYVTIMQNSPFSDFKITPDWIVPPDEQTLKILKVKYPYNDIWANGIRIEARK